MAAMKMVPVIAGPTASGKTDLALRLAQAYPVEVVSADASMVYRGMDIGTAKPSPLERQQVPHHLIDILDPDQDFSVLDYWHRAQEATEGVLLRGRIPLVVGGTGYYIRALSEGLYELPAPDALWQQELWKVVETEGLEPLLAELRAASPQDAERVGSNPRRVVRAVEILRRTGTPPAHFPRSEPRFRYRKLLLWPEWGWLEPRLQARTEAMFQQGLVEEVKGLLQRFPLMTTALQSIGYKEVAAHLRGETSLEEARLAVLGATRAYAKRQYTWFRKEPGEVTYLPQGGEAAWEGLLEWFQAFLKDSAHG